MALPIALCLVAGCGQQKLCDDGVCVLTPSVENAQSDGGCFYFVPTCSKCHGAFKNLDRASICDVKFMYDGVYVDGDAGADLATRCQPFEPGCD